jgi:hypothetical protein
MDDGLDDGRGNEIRLSEEYEAFFSYLIQEGYNLNENCL